MAHLDSYEILASKDLHDMQEQLARLTETHKVDVIGRGHEVNASLRSAAFGGLNLMHVTYGDVPTRVKTYETDEEALLLFVFTDGAARVEYQGEDLEFSPTKGFMRDARIALSARQKAFSSFVIPLPKEMLKRHAAAIQGQGAGDRDIAFDPTLDFTTLNGRHLRNTVHYIAEALEGPLRGSDNPILLDGMRDLLLTTVLSVVPNGYLDALQQTKSSGRIVPFYVKRARDYIHANAASSITLEALANHAGCGYRTLQVAFNEHYGMSPMGYVKHLRLTFAHEDLLNAADGMTVRDVALKWGFTHLGWFSKNYVEKFGVLPSQTLRTRG